MHNSSEDRETGTGSDAAPARRPWWMLWAWAAGTSAAVIVLVLAVVLIPSGRRHAETHTQPSPGQRPAPATPSAAAGFGLPTTDLFGARLDTPADPAGIALAQDPGRRPHPAGPGYGSAAPAGMKWQRGWGGAALPFSVSDGPALVRDGIASGFAQTPQGAGLAAYDALARALSAPDGVWQRVIAARYTGPPQALTARYARSRAGTPDAARYVVVPEGFRVDGYTPEFAVVRIAVHGRAGTAYTTWPMAWTRGDWNVRTPDDIEQLWAPPTPVSAGEDTFGAWR